tara:strand:+ start:31 stop:522 length:492 start_codon:yes stop_codon:yes gene_type:complete
MEDTKSLKERMADLEDKVIEQSVPKKEKFKLPKKVKLKKKDSKEGYVTICYLNNNKHVDFVKKPIIDNTIKIDDYHEVTADNIFLYKNQPMIFVPAWCEKPFNAKEHFDEAVEDGTLTMTQRYILNALETDKIRNKNKLSGKVIFFIILAVVAAGYFFSTGGG